MMKTKIVLGTLFGDEGKGTTVRWLCKNSSKPLVYRFSGGPQSAHTVIDRKTGIQHVCSSFGAGVLEGIPTVYIGGYFDPCSFIEEAKDLKNKGIEPPKVYLQRGKVKFITPLDVWMNRYGSTREKEDGTCGKGIYQTFNRLGDRIVGIYESYKDARKFYEGKIEKEIMDKLYDVWYDSIHHELFYLIEWIDSPSDIPHETRIFEGTQGLLLDMDHGYYPNVTPSRTGLNGIPKEYLEGAEVYLVCRSYLTEHGCDNYCCPLKGRYKNPYETNITNEYQGVLNIDDFDVDLIGSAIERHCLDNMQKLFNLKMNIVMTCLDVYNRDTEGEPFTWYRLIEAYSSLTLGRIYTSISPYSEFYEISKAIRKGYEGWAEWEEV